MVKMAPYRKILPRPQPPKSPTPPSPPPVAKKTPEDKLNVWKLLEHKYAGRDSIVTMAMAVQQMAAEPQEPPPPQRVHLRRLLEQQPATDASCDPTLLLIPVAAENAAATTAPSGADGITMGDDTSASNSDLITPPYELEEGEVIFPVPADREPQQNLPVSSSLQPSKEDGSINMQGKTKPLSASAGNVVKLKKKHMHPCMICGKKFPALRNLQRHMDSHSDEPKYQCETCDKWFKHKHNLKIHMGVHDETKAQKCLKCDFKCGSKAQLKQHMVVHDSCMYECLTCFKFFKSKVFFNHHMRLHSNSNISICEICGKKFALPCLLSKHMESHSDSYKYECTDCGKTYKQKRGLRRHQIEKHNTKSKTKYECRYCGRIWATPSTLKAHEMVHRQNKFGYKCNLCGEQFLGRTLYDIHCRMHLATSKTYECEVCGKPFVAKSTLELHKKSHFSKAKVKCLLCDKQFTTKYTLKRHALMKHRLSKLALNGAAHECQQCVKLLPVKIEQAICNILHGPSLDVEVVVRKLQHSDLPVVKVTDENPGLPIKQPDEEKFTAGYGEREIGVVIAPTDLNDSKTFIVPQEFNEPLLLKEEALEADVFPSSICKDFDLSQLDQQHAESKCPVNDSPETLVSVDCDLTSHDIKLEPTDFPVADDIIVDSVIEIMSSAEPQKIINIAPILETSTKSEHSENIGNLNSIFMDEPGSVIELINVTLEMPQTSCSEMSAQNHCLLTNGRTVKFEEKIAREFPFIKIAKEHNYFKFSDLNWVANNACIHGNMASKLESLFMF